MIRRTLLLLFTTIPLTTFANIELTEIMYDLEGSDSKREWVEIFNSGSEEIDISDWRFNDGSNHTISTDDGSLIVPSGTFAILASDDLTFKNEHNVSGLVFDTVMSLNNTSETVSFLDANGNIVDSVTYDSSLGASGDGNSLHRKTNVLVARAPTPLRGEREIPIPEIQEEEETVDKKEVQESKTGPVIQPYFWAYAGPDSNAVVSGIVSFEGAALDKDGNEVKNARFLWNLGDGHFKEGKNVSHLYLYPGEYQVSLIVSIGEFSSAARKVVTVREANVEITYANRGKIEVTNLGDVELDISYWSLGYKNQNFHFPRGTVLNGKTTGMFVAQATEITPTVGETISLLYPNGLVAHSLLIPFETKPFETKETQAEEIIVYKYVEVPKRENEDSVTESNETVSTTSVSTAPPVASTIRSNSTSESLYPWVLGLIVLISLGVLFYLGKEKDEGELRASDFKIIEH